MTRTAIIAAFPGELKFLVRHWQHEHHNGIDLWHWPHAEGVWIAACAGAGLTAATRAFAAAELYAQSHLQSNPQPQTEPHAESSQATPASPIDLVISTGWAGALHKVIEPGLAYSVCGVIDAKTGEMAPTADWRDDIWLVTSPIVANEKEKHRLRTAYSASLVDMEASAIARLSQMRNIPFYCIKGVSDGLDDNLPDFNRFIDPSGQLNLARLTLFALLRPWYWHPLIKMGENSKMAAIRIAAAVLDILDKEGTIRNRNGYPDRQR